MMRIVNRRSVGVAGLILGLLSSNGSDANVSLKNGNFFVGFTDVVSPVKVERVNNSKTAYEGMFGPGWGTEYETHLKKAPDASIVVHEYGGGADNRFVPPSLSENELNGALDKIVQAAVKAGVAGKDYRNKLKKDVTYRNEEWEKFKLQAREVPVGTVYRSNKFNSQVLRRVNDGYLREMEGGKKVEKFNNDGRLVKVSDSNGNYLDFIYSSDNHLKRISVGNKTGQNLSKVEFGYNNQGLLGKITTDNGKETEYRYNDRRELVYSRDVDNNVYTYEYDNQGRHNLTGIGYSDKTSMKISYWGLDKHENVKSVQERDGTTTNYDYKWNGDNVKVSVKIKSADGKNTLSSSEYAYEVAHNKDGSEWTRRLVATVDGKTTETTYNECCGLPLRIKEGKLEALFAYDGDGHLLKKTTPTRVTELEYDPSAHKVSKVTIYPKAKGAKPRWSKFEYDGSANLKYANNWEGKGVHLFYDGQGRIKTMVDNKKEQVNFEYNESSKPVKITVPTLGKIDVEYDNSTNIKKVNSDGRRVPAQVMAEFDGLLQIIDDAAVPLTLKDKGE